MRGLAVFLALAAAPVAAQDWATKDVCTVETPAIHADVFEPSSLETLEAAASEIANSTGRLWKVTSPIGAVSHLWGTYHSTDPNLLRLPDGVEALIKDAKTVAVEIDFVANTRAEARRLRWLTDFYGDAGDPFDAMLPEDGSIADLPPEISGWVGDRLFELGWGEDAYLALSPAGLARSLLSHPCDDFSGGVYPIQDDYIQLIGELAGAEILGLEDPADFFFDLKDKEDTVKAMTAVYASYLEPQTDNKALSTSQVLYLEGRIGMMMAWDAAFVTSILGENGPQALALTDDYLIDFRNERFLDALSDPLKTGQVFVAVGAFHLPGEAGLVEGLRAQGHTVTRVPLPGETK